MTFRRTLLSILLALASVAPLSATASGEDNTDANAQLTRRERVLLKLRADANDYYDQLLDLYLVKGDLDGLKDRLRSSRKHVYRLSKERKENVRYLRQAVMQHRPRWWKEISSRKPNTFTAEIWDRKFKANYYPSRLLGVQKTVGVRNGRLLFVVSWRPDKLDSNEPVEGGLAEKHNITDADLAECIAWHELGHNFISEFLPTEDVIELFNNHLLRFHQLQEFYADMTSIYHSSPKARKTQLLIRLPGILANNNRDPHVRAARAIGSLLLADVLSDPNSVKQRWPSIRLPSKVPPRDAERITHAYMLYFLKPEWTLEEDRKLRDLVKDFLTAPVRGKRYRRGEAVLRKKGTVDLPNGLTCKLMPSEDIEHQAKRDQWVAEQLQKAIDAEQTDTKPEKVSAEQIKKAMIKLK